MLTIKELQELVDLLNNRQDTLERVEEIFLSKFKDSEAVFRASYALSNLLALNLLTSWQRIAAIFLLIQNYKAEGIMQHPFGATILELALNTPQAFEKRMISDIIIDGRREHYSSTQIELLYDREQAQISGIEDRPELKQIQQQFLSNLPQISQKSQSQVKNVIRDFGDKDKQFVLPQFPLSLASIKQSEINDECFNIGFMRPIPSFLDIDSSEFQWLAPGVSPEVVWDNSAELSLKLSRVKSLLKQSLSHGLTKSQEAEIEKSLECCPEQMLSLEIEPADLPSLAKHNPSLASTLLNKLSRLPIGCVFVDLCACLPLTADSMTLLDMIVEKGSLPQGFVEKCLCSVVSQLLELMSSNPQRQVLAKRVIVLLKNLDKNKQVSLTNPKYKDSQHVQELLQQFYAQFSELKEVHQYAQSISQE